MTGVKMPHRLETSENSVGQKMSFMLFTTVVKNGFFFCSKNVVIMPEIGAQTHVNVNVVCPFLFSSV